MSFIREIYWWLKIERVPLHARPNLERRAVSCLAFYKLGRRTPILAWALIHGRIPGRRHRRCPAEKERGHLAMRSHLVGHVYHAPMLLLG